MKNRFTRLLFLASFIFFISTRVFAHEGMWIPAVLGSVHDEMKAMGLRLSAEDLYSVNHSSLKDAVALFGGGCTGEMVSPDGLLFTNHHCGFDYIQFHSSLEHDYLKDGFWAMNRGEELVCKGLSVSFVVSMEDVTAQVMDGVSYVLSAEEFEKAKRANIKKITEGVEKQPFVSASVSTYNYGNQFFLIISKKFNDVRFVGAPPSEIGKFGGDTDNWVWPRHTGDFSVFRIYADKDNNPAEYSADNVPFHPAHFFPISMKGVHEGDFSMVYGFPGRTEHFLISDGVDYAVNKSNKMRIKMRETSLNIIDAKMRSSDKLRIQYAAKQSGISNAYKKWIGQEMGLTRFDAIGVKKQEEADFSSKAKGKEEYESIIPNLKSTYSKFEKYNLARDGFIEYVFYGPEIFNAARSLNGLIDFASKSENKEEFESKKNEVIEDLRLFYKDFDLQTEKEIFEALTPLYFEYVSSDLGPQCVKKVIGESNGKEASKKMYDKSIMRDSTLAIAAIKKLTSKNAAKLMKDPVLKVSRDLFEVIITQLNPQTTEFAAQLNQEMSKYVAAKQKLLPSKVYWNDANSTLRISFGKVEGSSPRDGMAYTPFTTAEGILDKNATGNPDFYIGEKLKSLLQKKQYGQYAENGVLHVCYTGSNHTTGGNSGSPALNADGHLVGINFDRSWESTMSDLYYSPEICRNIMVDIRYVLWVIDEYAGAGYLVDEMKLVK